MLSKYKWAKLKLKLSKYMFKTRTLKNSMLIVFSLVGLVCYQNCSKISSQSEIGKTQSSFAALTSSCTLNDQAVADGQSVLAYQAPSVSFGQTCVSQSRVCSDGVLSGSSTSTYNFTTCFVQQETSLSESGAFIDPSVDLKTIRAIVGNDRIINTGFKALFNDGVWQLKSIFDPNAPTSEARFGLPQDIPFHGNNLTPNNTKWTLGVWRPSTGTWFISRDNLSYSGDQTVSIQLGVPGDIPLNSTSTSVIAVFRPSNGHWYVRNINQDNIQDIDFGQYNTIGIKGQKGDQPFITPSQGLSLYRPSTGEIFQRTSDFGSPGGFRIEKISTGLIGGVLLSRHYNYETKADTLLIATRDSAYTKAARIDLYRYETYGKILETIPYDDSINKRFNIFIRSGTAYNSDQNIVP